jgi:glycosyltransferase involved in cell wall biosynthesis
MYHPTVLTPIGSDIFRFPWLSESQYNKIKINLENSDYFIVNTEYSKSYLIKIFGINKNKIFINNLGSDLDAINDIVNNLSIDSILKEWNLKKDDMIIFLPRGTRDVFKPILNFFMILKFLTKKYKNIKVLVLTNGNFELTNMIKFLLKKQGLEKFVICIDRYLRHDEMIKIFYISNLTISMSYSDQMCSSIIESMYLRNIPLISDLPVYREKFRRNENYFSIDNSDPLSLYETISYCLNNFEEISSRIFELNKKIIFEKYNVKNNFSKLEKIYEKIISQ